MSARRFSRRRMVRQGGAGLVAGAIAATGLGRATAAPSSAAAARRVTPQTPTGWAEVDRQLAALAPVTGLLAAELVDGACRPVHAFNADQALASGSTFKLFILGELARQVEAGQVDWEQPLAIQERYKSVPGGDLRYAPTGTEFTVRYFAERMIQRSDNTATDHLLFFVGRENVERMLATMGVSDPTRDIPLLSTREFALLKFVYPTDKLDAYYAAPVAERRRIIADEIDPLPLSAFYDLPEQTAPVEIERLEWFFTREDLCHAMAALRAMAGQPGLMPVTEILSLETQLPFNGEVWPYVGFKGGSELGVLSGTWLLTRADGRHFVYSVALNNPTAAIDMAAAAAVMGAGRDLLAKAS